MAPSKKLKNTKLLKKKLIINKCFKGVYLSGNNITVQMPRYIQRIIIYNTHYKQFFSRYEISKIKQGIDFIILYSINSTKNSERLNVGNSLLPIVK